MKTSQEIATELARKCAKTLNYGDADPCDCPECKKYLEKQFELVLQSIPLVELLEFVAATSKYRYTFCNAEEQACELLTTKLKQLGIEI